MKRSKLNSTAYLMTIIGHSSVLFLRWFSLKTFTFNTLSRPWQRRPLRRGTRVRREFIGNRFSSHQPDRFYELELLST
ncbi:hypothetical protein SAMN06297164_0352 [Nitrosomonas ureae]|uniref:Uncharacterized protein n=1 Tax=Nitrosomonas ureae TaxID=44577 RepID=A0A286A309_9PROT|nr:hypothetical protein SAMN06297164_0352 [Nitrosomonas ureae]